MAKKRDTGAGEKYSAAEAERVAQAIENAFVDGLHAESTKLDVRAKIEWAGHVMKGNGGVRRTLLDLPAGGAQRLQAAAEKAARRRERAATAKPPKENVQHWHAQLRRLVESPVRGSKAADKVGLDVKERTLKRWLSDPDYPVRKGDRDKIAAAYQELRYWNVNEARAAAGRADTDAANVLTDVLREQYGVNIRFRDIEDFRFE